MLCQRCSTYPSLSLWVISPGPLFPQAQANDAVSQCIGLYVFSKKLCFPVPRCLRRTLAAAQRFVYMYAAWARTSSRQRLYFECAFQSPQCVVLCVISAWLHICMRACNCIHTKAIHIHMRARTHTQTHTHKHTHTHIAVPTPRIQVI